MLFFGRMLFVFLFSTLCYKHNLQHNIYGTCTEGVSEYDDNSCAAAICAVDFIYIVHFTLCMFVCLSAISLRLCEFAFVRRTGERCIQLYQIIRKLNTDGRWRIIMIAHAIRLL